MTNHMGHYCWMCGGVRPNEAFFGSGHRRHLCRQCKKIPFKERELIQLRVNLFDLLEQKAISKKNIAWLKKLTASSEEDIANLAGLLLEVALIRPYRKKRHGFLYHNHRALYEKLVAAELLDDWIDYDTESEPDWLDEPDEDRIKKLSEQEWAASKYGKSDYELPF